MAEQVRDNGTDNPSNSLGYRDKGTDNPNNNSLGYRDKGTDSPELMLAMARGGCGWDGMGASPVSPGADVAAVRARPTALRAGRY